MNLRRLPNGILAAPKRGTPPPVPEGYEIYHGDPYTFAPILPGCVHREMRAPARRCCNSANTMFCLYLERRVVRTTCADCGGKP